MALESASYINGLVSSNPAAGDPVTQADDHMRLIKATLLATFPNITGAVTPTHTELNALQAAAATAVSTTGTQTLTNKTLTAPVVNTATINASPIGGTTPAAGAFTTLAASGAVGFIPTGIICLWYGSTGSVPTGWYLCDGTNGTPNLRDKFIVGAGTTYAVGATGGSADAVNISHTHTASVTDPGHTHSTTFDNCNQMAVGSVRIALMDPDSTSITGSETIASASNTTGITVSNSTEGVSGTNLNLPPYHALCYIMRA